MTYKNYVCVFVQSWQTVCSFHGGGQRDGKRNSTTYLRYPEEAQSVQNGGDIMFVFSLFLYFLLVCLKRRAENKIDNNGYQFQEKHYLKRNEIIYWWLLSTQYTLQENKNADVFCKANNFCSLFLHLSREVVPHFVILFHHCQYVFFFIRSILI